MSEAPGIDLRADAQAALLAELAPLLHAFPPYTDEPSPVGRFRTNNGMFAGGDAVVLYAVLRHFRPRRIIEVGSGFSSALMIDTNERDLNGQTRITFIEPYPDRLKGLLRADDLATYQLLQRPVQEVPPSTFEALEAGDILFIDCSHVSKIGSDLNHLLFEVIPALRPGVLVHFHDIFWPFEYPLAWLELKIFWNENYLVRAFLQYNHEFEILLFLQYLADQHPGPFREHVGDYLHDPGQSLWLRRRGPSRAEPVPGVGP